MDIVSYILSRAYVKKSLVGVGALKGAPCTIASIVDNLDGTHDITFSWKDNTDVTHTSVLTVKDGETPAFSSVAITGGHRLTFITQDPAQSVSFNVMDGVKGDMGISVVASNVDENNNLTLTLSNGNVINAGKIKAVTNVDNTLSTTSSNPVENKVITNALNNKVDKEMGKGLFSDTEKTKLANIEDGAQVNVLEKLIVNGQEATITDKSIALTLITSAVSNLQNYYLKTETYTKQEVEDLIGSTVGVTIEIVEQLPTEGQSNVIYFLPTETEGVYSQYIYSNNSWILIGSTTVDLSNYYTKTQVDTLLNGKQNVLTIDSFPTALSNNPVASGGVYTAIAQMQPQFQFANMPTASASNLGFVYQYTGATGTYTQNMFYRCIYDDTLGEYKWVEVIFHATVTVDSAISGTSTNPVQNKVIKEALDTKQDIMQYSTMPSAQDNLGKIVQYIGTNTANYTNGYFYKAVYNSESDVYLWTVIKFSADMLVDNALSTTSENPVQNKVITSEINGIKDLIPQEASSTNQLVDRDSLGTASQKDFTPYVSPDNTDVPISSSVYSAITSAVYGAYHPSGSKTIAELTSDLLVLANIGNVYKITEDGVTTNLFIGGAGQTIHTGDNAVVVYGGQPNTFLFDLQSGSIDLTPYQTKALENTIEGETTVEGALGALSTNKADKVSSATAGDIATLDANGNLVDSGYSKSLLIDNTNGAVKAISTYASASQLNITDANDIKFADAMIYCNSSVSNLPTADYYNIKVFSINNDSTVYEQIAFRSGTPVEIYTRRHTSLAGWTNWQKLVIASDLNDYMYQNRTRTNDVLADALNISTPTILEGGGTAYTGNVPYSALKYAIFLVIPRGGDRFVIGWINGVIAVNNYNSIVWNGWTLHEQATSSVTSDSTAPVTSGGVYTEIHNYGIKTIWTGSKTKGDTGMNFDASPYDLCFAQIGGTLCRLVSGMGTGTSGRKKFTAVYAGRDNAGAGTYEQYYILDIVPDGTIATCGWFDIGSKDNQNAKLAGQKALELALAGTSTWTNPTWKTLADVETNVNVTKIIGIKFQTKS